jgi:uncharacterized protein YjbI with pentapeptide repeats
MTFWQNVSKTLLGLLLVMLLALEPANAALQNYSHIDLQNRDFASNKLVGGVFLAAEMRGVNFSNADLTNAIFTKGVLLQANMHGANLTGALLDQVTLDNADLTDAILAEAIMTRSRFYGTKITGADFTNAIIDRSQVKLLCENAAGTNSQTGVETRESLGC